MGIFPSCHSQEASPPVLQASRTPLYRAGIVWYGPAGSAFSLLGSHRVTHRPPPPGSRYLLTISTHPHPFLPKFPTSFAPLQPGWPPLILRLYYSA